MDSTINGTLTTVSQVSPMGLLQIFFGLILTMWLWRYWRNRISVPIFGGPFWFSRTLALGRLRKHEREEFLRAYAEDPMILVPRLDSWALLTHSKYIDELSRAPDDVLSFMDAATDMVQLRYTFGPRIADDHYHHNVIRNQLTRNLSSLFPEVLDETQLAISEFVKGDGNAWDTFNVFSFVQQVVTRASNRIFVGVPLCRNKAWVSLNITAAMDTLKVIFLINMFPTALRPIIGRLFSPAHRRLIAATKLAGPYVEERLAQAENERSNDFISWVIAQAPPHERNPKDITNRVLVTNFTAIHTSSMNVTHALYWLLARPEYIEPLRTEIGEVTEKLGWTKEAIGVMPILDSFMKECMRLTPVTAQVMSRKALKPFTFSNGVRVSTGTVISTHLYATHLDEKHYTDASSFDGFRFVETPQVEKGKLEQDDAKESATRNKKTMYTTSPTYLSFGHGRHACPGRFFASMEVKLILAHLISNYDMKWPEDVYQKAAADGTRRGEDGSYRPPDIWFANAIVPNRGAKMLIHGGNKFYSPTGLENSPDVHGWRDLTDSPLLSGWFDGVSAIKGGPSGVRDSNKSSPMTILPEMWDMTSAGMNSPIFWLHSFSVSVVVVILWQYWQNRFSIPTYGGIASFSRTLSAQRLRATGRDECMRAYAKDPIVLVPVADAWAAMAHSKYADEISRAPDDVLSFMDAAAEGIQMKYTFGPKAAQEHYHIQVIRNQLTRHLSGLFPDVLKETEQAMSDYVGTEANEWRTMNVVSLVQKVVSRASNRIFVGIPLCRNEEWMALMISVAVTTMQVSTFINKFPAILRPLVGWYKSPSSKNLDTAMKIAGSVVERKLADPEGTETDDFISWLITAAPEHERNPRDILNRLLLTNFAAIHTSSLTLTNGLYWLLARPQYVDPLLQEITEVISRLGWSKEAIGAMPKLDSFLKECMRITPFGTQVLRRKVRKPFTFSNGFQALVGMTVATHLYATHHDENLYPHPDVFDGFRFAEPATAAENENEKAGGESAIKKTMYTTSRSYLPFGHGRHACPGRFFASMEVKLVLAYLIMNYEMKWPATVYDPSAPGYTEEGYRPPDHCYIHNMTPNTEASMMIRKRVST